ncbi:fungal-specific transcription factor domain-containing protein [Desarmillaria ectypa]|nr:fungal-specific transcription factor domain-containing protein [Desarmillaria ectypa]
MSHSPNPSASVELKANGEMSRIRSHRGNAPTLPQTKHCPLCPAKFTRTTHLSRHIRSHTNERAHRCKLCGAEFTRSDLLTRHKKTCGDPLKAHRSRRKSCQACVESKVKCDLQCPCSKCISRGKKCVFINDPAVTRYKQSCAKKRVSQTRDGNRGIDVSVQGVAGTQASPTCSLNSLSSPSEIDDASPTLPHIATPLDFRKSEMASSHTSPQPAIFDPATDDDNNSQIFGSEHYIEKMFSSNVLDSFLEQFSLSDHDSTHSVQVPSGFSWLGGDGLGSEGTYPYSLMQTMPDVSTVPQSPDFDSPVDATATNSPIPSEEYAHSTGVSTGMKILDTEKEQYLYLFFSAFCTQLPLVHPETWMEEDKPSVLVRAMQACGALFVTTRSAMNFINETLSSTRDVLVQQFTKAAFNPNEQDYLILAVVLLQTIGLFHQRAENRVSSNVYHGMLVMMIRKTGSITRSRSWAVPDLNDSVALEQTWREWAQHETVKRALLLSYLHDCCHSVFFSIRPSFEIAEFDLNLPCDEALWKAQSAREWYELLQKPSAYGTGADRLYSVGMQQALTNLGEIRLHASHTPLNPFSQFILIHTILQSIYKCYSSSDAPTSSPALTPDGEGHQGSHFATQCTLHNWLQMWIHCPDTVKGECDSDEPPFAFNALPFYWLAQVSLLAIQEGGSEWIEATTAENRFHLIKEWLDRIRFFLRQNHEIPPNLWEELMAIRRQVSQVETHRLADHPNGLLAFFQEH